MPPPSEPTVAAVEPWSTTPVRTRSPLPLLAVPCTSSSPVLPLPRDWTTNMVRTRGGHRYRPRVRFSTPEMEDASTSRAEAHSLDLPIDTQPALAPAAIPEEPQAFRKYQTRMGPRSPSPMPQRQRRRARPSKRARTLGLGESSRSLPEQSPPHADEGSSPQLTSASRIRRPMFTSNPIRGNVDLCARDFHGEPYYDIPALTTDQRFRNLMRLIRQYSLLPFMTPRQFFYPQVVLEFYHNMTSRGVPSPLELRFSINGLPGVLRVADITAAIGLPAALVNSSGYKAWPQPSQREMVCCLSRDTTVGPILFRRQLPP